MKKKTETEWRLVSAGAEALLRLESVRLGGFLVGGPEISVERCQAVLREAEALGVVPTEWEVDLAIGRLVRAWTRER
jgi:hypothetical protein